jgi:hypothetical protein
MYAGCETRAKIQVKNVDIFYVVANCILVFGVDLRIDVEEVQFLVQIEDAFGGMRIQRAICIRIEGAALSHGDHGVFEYL